MEHRGRSGLRARVRRGRAGRGLPHAQADEQHAGDVLDDLQLDETQREEFGRCAGLARPANRRVLGCLLANLRAMRVVCERRNALIVEDNVRPLLEDASQSVLKVLDDACDLLYLGHLAHADTLQSIPRGLSDAPELTTDGQNHELWGTYAYRPSLVLYQKILEYIRDGFPKSLFHCRRRDCDVVPDRQAHAARRAEGESHNQVPRAAGLLPHAAGAPVKIHRKWDAGYEEASRGQLALYGLAWRDVWLTPAEREIVEPPRNISSTTCSRTTRPSTPKPGPSRSCRRTRPPLYWKSSTTTRCVRSCGRSWGALRGLRGDGRAWRSARPGRGDPKVVDDLAADHLRPDGMLERLRGGVDAASYGVATLLGIWNMILKYKQHQMPRSARSTSLLRDGACNAHRAGACRFSKWRRRLVPPVTRFEFQRRWTCFKQAVRRSASWRSSANISISNTLSSVISSATAAWQRLASGGGGFSGAAAAAGRSSKCKMCVSL